MPRIDYLAACGHDWRRKPQAGAWEFYLAFLKRGGYTFDAERRCASFYCGDAAGREGDFSDSDLLFAHNINLRFLIPENAFGHRVWKIFPRPDNPELETLLSPTADQLKQWDVQVSILAATINTKTVLIMIGAPASGKSSIARRLAKEAKCRVSITSRDVTGRKERCLRAMDDALRAGDAIIIDNTNPSAANRAYYVQGALAAGAEKIVFVWVFTAPVLVWHLNGARSQITRGPLIPEIAYRVYRKRFERPDSEKEGAHSMVALRPVVDTGHFGPASRAEIVDFRY